MYDLTSFQILDYHNSMLSDEARLTSYLKAILQTVQAGDLVLDIGSGTGILTYFACMAGAQHVYAVEQGPVINLARQICRENGLEERITFIKSWSHEIELPEPVDVVITETIGNAGFEEGILGWIFDARKRHLKPGGQIIPSRLALWIVPVEIPREYDFIDSWSEEQFTFNYAAAHTLAANNLHYISLSTKQMMAESACIFQFNLAEDEANDFEGVVTFTAARDGCIHGIGGWFQAEICPGILLSNQPPNQVPSWHHVLFPLTRPVQVMKNEQVRVAIKSQANATHWQWRADLPYKDLTNGISHSTQLEWSQSTQKGSLTGYMAIVTRPLSQSVP